jgi:hypothetical protein
MLTLKVSQENINKANSQHAYNIKVYAETGRYEGVDEDGIACMCPIQWALKDAGFTTPFAGYGLIWGIDESNGAAKRRYFTASHSALSFMKNWDVNKNANPTTLFLEEN